MAAFDIEAHVVTRGPGDRSMTARKRGQTRAAERAKLTKAKLNKATASGDGTDQSRRDEQERAKFAYRQAQIAKMAEIRQKQKERQP